MTVTTQFSESCTAVKRKVTSTVHVIFLLFENTTEANQRWLIFSEQLLQTFAERLSKGKCDTYLSVLDYCLTFYLNNVELQYPPFVLHLYL